MTDKRIGIVTLQRSLVNYGAALQGYALWRFICTLGYDCEVVDILRPCHKGYVYSPEFGEGKPSLKHRMANMVRDCIGTHRKFEKREKLFSAFHDKLRYSHQYKSLRELYANPPSYDVYVTGSDQVWNPNMPFYNGVYFWDFIKDNGKRVSYASSFSIDVLPEKFHADYAKWLNAFQYLSVREDSGTNIIKNLTGRDSSVVLDPVFLLSKEEWEKCVCKVDGVPEHYVFLYLVKYDAGLIDKAKRVAHENSLPLFVVLSSQVIITDANVHQIINAGPQEWLWLFCHADYIMTDSFHGTSFSAILQKKFVVFVNPTKNTNSRIKTILESLNLTSQMIITSSQVPMELNQFDYDKVATANILVRLVEASKNYLNKALK